MSVVEANFRKNLANVLARNGTSQYELNRLTGISRAYINKVLKGATNPSLEYCAKLAAGVKVPLTMLLLEPEKFEQQIRQLDNEQFRIDAATSSDAPALSSPKPPTESEESQQRLIWIKRLLKHAKR